MSDSMCTQCNQFFGNPKMLNMCSVCFKKHNDETKIKEQLKDFKMLQVPQPTPVKQADRSRCFACRKKVGLLGYQCKSCGCSYCGNHRLPQEHSCGGNFVEQAKNALRKKSQTIVAPKIEQI